MPFQFTCPNGHFLHAEPHQAGQQCQCPTCGLMFMIPAPPMQTAPMAMPATPDPSPMAGGPFATAPGAAPWPQEPAPGTFPPPPAPAAMPVEGPPEPTPSMPDPLPRIGSGPSFPDVATPGATGRQAFDPTGEVTGPQMLHIPCPEGHILETPPEMLGEEVICPHCGRQYTLREKDSQEYKRKKKQEREKLDIRSGKRWLTWAVVIAVVVITGLILMIALGEWM